LISFFLLPPFPSLETVPVPSESALSFLSLHPQMKAVPPDVNPHHSSVPRRRSGIRRFDPPSVSNPPFGCPHTRYFGSNVQKRPPRRPPSRSLLEGKGACVKRFTPGIFSSPGSFGEKGYTGAFYDVRGGFFFSPHEFVVRGKPRVCRRASPFKVLFTCCVPFFFSGLPDHVLSSDPPPREPSLRGVLVVSFPSNVERCVFSRVFRFLL